MGTLTVHFFYRDDKGPNPFPYHVATFEDTEIPDSLTKEEMTAAMQNTVPPLMYELVEEAMRNLPQRPKLYLRLIGESHNLVCDCGGRKFIKIYDGRYDCSDCERMFDIDDPFEEPA